MKLGPYNGPFEVGVVDLETLVRNPRNFIPGYLDPVQVNKLARGDKKIKRRRARKILEHLQNNEGEPIEQDANDDVDEEVKQERERERKFLEDNGLQLRNATLQFRTVLMSIYYPCTDLSHKEVKRYPRSSWLGRCVKKNLI